MHLDAHVRVCVRGASVSVRSHRQRNKKRDNPTGDDLVATLLIRKVVAVCDAQQHSAGDPHKGKCKRHRLPPANIYT